MQRIIGERLRPAESKDPYGLEQAKTALAVALTLAEKEMPGRTWAAGEDFSMADCAAAPPLFYLDFGRIDRQFLPEPRRLSREA
jgi:glutathione S-transferase